MKRAASSNYIAKARELGLLGEKPRPGVAGELPIAGEEGSQGHNERKEPMRGSVVRRGGWTIVRAVQDSGGKVKRRHGATDSRTRSRRRRGLRRSRTRQGTYTTIKRPVSYRPLPRRGQADLALGVRYPARCRGSAQRGCGHHRRRTYTPPTKQTVREFVEGQWLRAFGQAGSGRQRSRCTTEA